VLIPVAVRRYAEGTAQIIFHDLLLDIQDGSKLLQDLREEVGIFSRDAHKLCLEFIEPSEETRKERSDLESKRALLEEVLEEMHIGKQRGPSTRLTADSLVSFLRCLVLRSNGSISEKSQRARRP
jgi:hypothetical protein